MQPGLGKGNVGKGQWGRGGSKKDREERVWCVTMGGLLRANCKVGRQVGGGWEGGRWILRLYENRQYIGLPPEIEGIITN
jgi:hypothetical protein